MTVPEAVDRVLKHIETTARYADPDDPYRDLLALPELPIEPLSELGPLQRLDDLVQTGTADSLPSLMIGIGRSGQVQIELCPFGPLALIVSDGDTDTDSIAHVLVEAGITPLFPNDLDQASEWHGKPLGLWLFPRRLPDALTLFDTLH